MKRLLSILLALVLVCTVFTACGKEQEIDPTTQVASIGDESVTYALYKVLFDSYVTYMQQSGYDPYASESELDAFQDWIIDYLVMDLVVLYNAKADGFTLSDEARTEMEAQAEEELNDIYEEYYGYAEEDFAKDDSKTVQEYFDEYIMIMSQYYTGIEMSFEEYSIQYRQELENTYLITAYKDFICSGFEVTTDDALEWFSDRATSDATKYTSTPAQYKVDQEYYEKYFGIHDDALPPTYVPAGYHRIMDIVISPSGELSDQYAKNESTMDNLYAEYCTLAFEDALNGTDDNAERIDEILTEYAQLKEQNDAEYIAFSDEVAERMAQAYEELENGASFADVMLKYTQNPFVIGDDETVASEAFRTKGQIISLTMKSASDWSDTVKAEFAKLSIGEYSEVFIDEDGSYHIIYYVSNIKSGEVAFKDILEHAKISAKIDSDAAKLEVLISDWMDDPKLILNEELIRSLGRDKLTGN